MTIIKQILCVVLTLLMVVCCNPTTTSNEDVIFTDSIIKTRTNDSPLHVNDLKALISRRLDSDSIKSTDLAWDLCNRMLIDSLKKYVNMSYQRILTQADTTNAEIKNAIAEMQLTLAYIQSRGENNQDSAQALIKRSISTFEQYNKPLRLIECYIYLAEINRLKDDPNTGYSYLRKIDQIYKNLSDKEITDMERFELLVELSKMSVQVGMLHFGSAYLRNASILYDLAPEESKAQFLLQKSLIQFYHQDYSQADYSAKRLEAIAKSVNDTDLLRQAYAIEGISLSRLDMNDEAMAIYETADSINKTYNGQLINSLKLLEGEINVIKNDFAKAHELLFDSLNYTRFSSHPNTLLESQKKYYLAKKDYANAFLIENRERMNTERAYTIITLSNEHDTEIMSDEYQRLQIKIEEVNTEKEKILGSHNQERIIFGTLVFIITVVIIIYKRNERRRNNKKVQQEYTRLKDEIKQKVEQLRHQKEALQITNNRISESFRYAERIQHSIMPHPEELNKYPIGGSFVFYSPLDVVSGDFFWFTRKGDHLIVCCADCTGHGVPGAFMSMIASTLLNDISHKSSENITPAEILSQLDEKLLDILAQNQAEDGASKDGLDIAIVSIDLNSKLVLSSAAKRPIIMIKDQDILQIKGTRRSIGDTEKAITERQFTNTETQLHTGDTIYMYTDGYSDQFGGSNCKKMKSNKIKKFLRAQHDDDMEEQCLAVQELFTQWKGDNPQTDDVLFIGLKI